MSSFVLCGHVLKSIRSWAGSYLETYGSLMPSDFSVQSARPAVSMPTAANVPPPHASRLAVRLAGTHDLSSRKCFAYITLLRLIQKLSKNSPVHLRAMAKFRAQVRNAVTLASPHATFATRTRWHL